MEAEANEFSALLLMPPPALRKFISKERDPNLAHIPLIAKHFRVSKEAAARGAYARYHDQNVAIIVIKDGRELNGLTKARSFHGNGALWEASSRKDRCSIKKI